MKDNLKVGTTYLLDVLPLLREKQTFVKESLFYFDEQGM